MLLEFSTYTPKFHFVRMCQILCFHNNDAEVRLQLEHYHCDSNCDMQGAGTGKLSSLPLQVVIYFTLDKMIYFQRSKNMCAC